MNLSLHKNQDSVAADLTLCLLSRATRKNLLGRLFVFIFFFYLKLVEEAII